MDRERAVQEVAEKYRCDGYRVVLLPGPGDLPAFAAGHTVDFLAFKDGERALVRVQTNRAALGDDPEMAQLAEIANEQAGWRLDVAVLPEEGVASRVSPGAAEPPVEKILTSLTTAEHLSAAGELPASSVMSWAALEAAMRHAARGAAIELKDASPSFLLRALYSGGLLDREAFDRLNDAMKVRNAVVHGFDLPPINPALPRYVVSIARKLLSRNGNGIPSQ